MDEYDDHIGYADGEWISWEMYDDGEESEFAVYSRLAELEREADLKRRFPKADISLIPFFENLLVLAEKYHRETGSHLQVYGDIGELFGAIEYGIKLHNNYAQGSDGRLGDDFVEIKTIAPTNKKEKTSVRLDGHFSKLLVVKIDENFDVSARLVERKSLQKRGGNRLVISWDGLLEKSE